MISRRQFVKGSMCAFALAPSVAFSARSDEHQAITSNVKNLLEALDFIGQPIEPGDKSALSTAISAPDPAESLRGIRRVLSKYVLARITINPESRVNVAPGDARPILVEAGWRAFCLEVSNESSVTSALQVVSPQAKAAFEYSPGSDMTPTGIAPRGAAYPVQTVKPLDEEGGTHQGFRSGCGPECVRPRSQRIRPAASCDLVQLALRKNPVWLLRDAQIPSVELAEILD
jgi:hypothetical protein